jgi:kumamolisin
MATPRTDYVDLPGSEKVPHAFATVNQQQPVDPEERATVTIVPAYPDAVPAILAFATENHLAASIEHGLVKVTGRLGDLQAAFDVRLAPAVTETGVRFRHRVGPVRVPAPLASAISAVLGLDNRPQAQPRFRQQDDVAAPHAFTATQVAALYHFPGGDGTGRTVDIIELGGGFSSTDLQHAGLDPTLVTAVAVDGASNSYSGDPNSADGEVALDIQVIGGVAPKARQRVYFAPNTDAGFVDAIAASLAATPPPDAVSISWGAPESAWTQQARNAMESLFAQLVAKGIPVFAASGDNGSTDGTPTDVTDFPASAPHATGCGGTVLTGSGTTISSEVAWPDGGGGISKAFPAPPFQAGLGLAGRGVPDIAGNAAPQTGYQIFIGGPSPLTFGGTSAVAPLWAGLTALVVAALGHAVGNLNAQLYPLIGTTALRDITQGTNGGFPAKLGWDGVTGCGTPVGQDLVTKLKGSQPILNPVGFWTINGNGFPGVLAIPSIDPQGNLGAGSTVYGQPIFGFWDDPAQKLTFMRVITPTDPTTFQVYTGYLMRPQPGSGQPVTLAGAFEAFQGTGAVAQRSVFGWYAQPRIA